MQLDGQRLKTVRILRGLTLKDVAHKIGVQEATIQRYESGQIKNISNARVLALAQAIDTSSEYLLGIGSDESQVREPNLFIDWMLTPSETTGQNIKQQRSRLNLSVAELAELVGVSRQTIYRYEAGVVESASPRTLAKLAQALQTSVAYVLGKTEDPLDISVSASSITDIFTIWAREDAVQRGIPDKKNRPKPPTLEEVSDLMEAMAEADEKLLETVHRICKTDKASISRDALDLKLKNHPGPAKIKLVQEFIEDSQAVLQKMLANIE